MTFLKGDKITYQKALNSYFTSVSKALVPEGKWRRYKPKLMWAASIERGRRSNLYHIHVVIRKPTHVPLELFEETIREKAKNNPWIEQGPFSVDFQPITGTPLNLMNYITEDSYGSLIYPD